MVKYFTRVDKADAATKLERPEPVYIADLFATAAEITTGTEDEKVVTPAALIAGRTASATMAGIVELATSAESVTGTDDARAVTPADLKAAATTHVSAASTSAAGKVELATDAEAKAQADTARAVTPANLGAVLANLVIATFTGHNEEGACTLTGATTDSVVVGVAGLTSMGIASASFESVITVVDQIQQSSSDNLSAENYICILSPLA
jgi:hypothetical protein